MTGNRDKKTGEATPTVELEQINTRRWQIRFNFKEIPATDMMPASWQYEYVNVDELTKKIIKKAIIKTKYDHDDELSTINDQVTRPDAYATYQALRTQADGIVAKVI